MVRAREARGAHAEPRARDVVRALEDVMRDDDGVDDDARAEAVDVVLNLSLDVSTSWREKVDALARGDDGRSDIHHAFDVSDATQGADEMNLSRIEALLMMDDDAYLAEIAPASTTKALEMRDDACGDDDIDEDDLIARALCELNAIKRVFYRWATIAEDARNVRLRERETRAICEFHMGRRMRRILVRAIRAWAVHARRSAVLRRFERGRAMRAQRDGLRAWRRAAEEASTRRLDTIARIRRSTTARVKRKAFEMWKRTASEFIANARAHEWRRVAIKATALEAWRRGVGAIKAEREAMYTADVFHALRVQMRAFGVWQRKIARAHAMVKKAVVRAAFTRWRRIVRTAKFDVQQNILAAQYDEARVMHVIFALWRINARERRAEARAMRRARAFRRSTLSTNTFYAWVIHLRRAKASRARLLFRAFSVWFTRVKRARRLEDIALYYVDSQAISFRDKYAPQFFFAEWREFVFGMRRRYAAMEFAEHSLAVRAFRTWRHGPAMLTHIVAEQDEQFVENTARVANIIKGD